MHFSLSERELDIRARGQALVEALIPFELPVDEADDDVPPELELTIRTIFMDSGLFAPNSGRAGDSRRAGWPPF